MSTRAVYTFTDHAGTFHVYKHHDGYPKSAIHFIKAAFGAIGFTKLAFAAESPRCQANDLAVSFVIANKTPTSCSELTSHYDRHGDLDYRYEITNDGREMYFDVEKKNFVISVFKRNRDFDNPTYDLIFRGLLDKFEEFANKNN